MRELSKTIVAAILGGCISFGATQAFKDENENKVVIEKVPVTYSRMASNYTKNPDGTLQVDFSYAAEKVTPAVVHIKSTVKSSGRRGSAQSIPPQLREFFGDQFGQFEESPRYGQASGSGVIISDNGYIVTNNHVVENASELEVTLYDKRSFKAKVVGTDPSTDLALIQIDAKGLPKLPLANSDNIKVGQWVLAVGNPFNLSSTVTAGIVSAKGRNHIIQNEGAIESFIQTDAAVNPGNSGGALVNLNGELVGINTAIFSETGTFAGYSFAVPTSIVSRVVEDLVEFGKVQRAVLGIHITDMNSQLAKETGIDVTKGVYIQEVLESGSAKAAGLQKGDVILKIDDIAVNSVPQLQVAVSSHKPGDKVQVLVNRKGKEKTINVTLKNATAKTELVKASSSETLRTLGADMSNLTSEEAKKLAIEGGVKVNQLFMGKLRSQTDIKEGFIITRVNKTAVRSVEDVVKAIESTKGGVLIEGIYPDDSEVHYFAFGM
jgi:Do/DeqQ family serine protease